MTATILPFPNTQATDSAYAAYAARFEERLAKSPWLRETLERAQTAIAELPARISRQDADLMMFNPADRERARQLLQEVGQAMCKLPPKR